MAFVNTNLQNRIVKTISSIIGGQKIKANEQILNQLRKQSDYALIMCNLLARFSKDSVLNVSSLIMNKKLFLALQIKKHSQSLINEQNWYLLTEVYYSDNEKIAKIIRQICIFYQQIEKSSDTEFLAIFFKINFQNIGIVGVVRYLQLIYELIEQQIQNLQNSTVSKYGSVIVKSLFNLINLQIQSDFIFQYALTNLILLQGFFLNHECWAQKQQWNQTLNRLAGQRQSTLLKTLANILKNSINKTHMDPFNVLNSMNKSQILNSIAFCLDQTKNSEFQLTIQKKFYIDSLAVINANLFNNFKEQCMRQEEFRFFISEVVNIFSKNIENEIELETKQIYQDVQNQWVAYTAHVDKKYSILKSILQNISKQNLKSLMGPQRPFQMQIISFSLFLPFLVNDQNYHCLQDFEKFLGQLSNALQNENDAYLFVKEKAGFIWILLKFIQKFTKIIDKQLILKTCYVVDLLAFKCDTISAQCYKLLQIISEEVRFLQSYELVQFVETSLSRINSSEWLQSHQCYFHVINLIFNLKPQCLFNKSTHNSYSICQQLSHLQKQILIMTNNMIFTLQKTFDYQAMHKLNGLISFFLLLNGEILIYTKIRIEQIAWVVQSNFSNEILTPQSAQIYFYFCQISQKIQNFIESVDKYDFWKMCQSQKLQFFVSVYLKFVDSKVKFFSLSEEERRINMLKKNLWNRFVSENSMDEREKIVKVFQKYPKYLSELFCEYSRSLNRTKGTSLSRWSNEHCSKMQMLQNVDAPKCRYPKCRYPKCRYPKCRCSKMQMFENADVRKCRYPKCRYPKTQMFENANTQ